MIGTRIPYLLPIVAMLPVLCHADWREVKRQYETQLAELRNGPKPDQYVLAGKTIGAQPDLGMNVHTMDQRVARQLRAAGIRAIRKTIYWHAFEAVDKPGVYNPEALAKLDAEVRLMLDEGLDPLLLVHSAPRGLGYDRRQEAYERFADFMAFLAKRYPKVRYWELWNEMDVAFTDVFGANRKDVPMLERGKLYAEMLKLAYPRIKAANPDAIVVTGGMTNWTDFPKGIYAGGGKDFFDIMNIHTYGVPLEWSFVTRGVAIRQTMDANGDSEKPIWNTEYGISANDMIGAWGKPKGDPCAYFDSKQKQMIMNCIEINQQTRLYSRSFVYVFHDTFTYSDKMRETVPMPAGQRLEDYHFGMTRSDGVTPRPVLEAIARHQEMVQSDTPTEPQRLHIQDGQLRMKGKPFFPIGFCFGASEEGLKRAKEVGMNCVHQEYSIRDVLPNSPDEVSEEGLAKIRRLHELCRQQDMVYFPLLTGHYIPGWLSKAGCPKPVDVDGKPIGLWFRHSLHDSTFRKALETFWTAVAREVGSDPNTGAFVTWNEPAYGLDATPPALAAYRTYLRGTYGTVEAMDTAFGTEFATFDAVQPPRTPDENRRYWYHWVLYNQQAFADFFAWERDVFKTYAPTANLTAKHPVSVLTGDAHYCNDITLQAGTQDIYGCDAYNGSLFHYRNVMEAARSLSGKGPVITFETHAQKGIPPLKPQHAALQLFVQILGGCRGMIFFCAGDQPQFGFDSDQATPPAVREELTTLFRFVSGNQETLSLPRSPARIAVLLANPSVIHYGFDTDPAQRDFYSKRVSQTYDMLRNQHHAVDFISNRQLADRLRNYELLVVPSYSILGDEDLKQVADFHRKGGKLIAFADSFAKDPFFADRPELPGFLGLKKRQQAPWNRDQMRLVEVAPELVPFYDTELTVQSPEQVNPGPMQELIPGYIPKTEAGSTWLAANQDAYPSIVLSSDGQVAYCAFDSLYSPDLSRLVAGIAEGVFGLKPELAVTPGPDCRSAQLMTALVGTADSQALMVANTGPRPGIWTCTLRDTPTGTLTNIATNATIPIENGTCTLSLAPYEYAVFRIASK